MATLGCAYQPLLRTGRWRRLWTPPRHALSIALLRWLFRWAYPDGAAISDERFCKAAPLHVVTLALPSPPTWGRADLPAAKASGGSCQLALPSISTGVALPESSLPAGCLTGLPPLPRLPKSPGSRRLAPRPGRCWIRTGRTFPGRLRQLRHARPSEALGPKPTGITAHAGSPARQRAARAAKAGPINPAATVVFWSTVKMHHRGHGDAAVKMHHRGHGGAAVKMHHRGHGGAAVKMHHRRTRRRGGRGGAGKRRSGQAEHYDGRKHGSPDAHGLLQGGSRARSRRCAALPALMALEWPYKGIFARVEVACDIT